MLGTVDAGMSNLSPSLVGERQVLRQGCYKVLNMMLETISEVVTKKWVWLHR